MDKQNKSFREVLKDAQNLGYAESNPTADLNGDDVSSKLKFYLLMLQLIFKQ